MAEKKTTPRNIRYPADLVEKLDKLSEFLFEEGIHAQQSFAATVVVVLRQADKLGLMDSPPTWLSRPPESKRR